jgi:hypothetical protein
VAKLREMGGQVGSAPACYGSSLGSNPDMSQKYKMCDISKGLANTLKPTKKVGIQKKLIINFSCLLLVLVGEEITLEFLIILHTQGGEEIVLVLQDEVPVVVRHVGGQDRPEEGHLLHITLF